MKTRARERILLAVAAVVMLGAFTQPLWSIKLTAPQYKEGLGLHISIDKITGHDTHDIQNINILNHYIGMKPIEPDAVPELTYMPWILTGLIVTGLIVALVGSRWLMLGWFVTFLGLGVAGLWDFYLWNLDYGHNLSPDAPIKVPGMTYSPPLLGQKVILNMTARSYPHFGTLYLSIAAILSGWAVFRSFRRPSSPGANGPADSTAHPEARSVTPPALVALLLAVVAAGCSPGEGAPAGSALGPGGEPVDSSVERMVYGADEDPFCGGSVDRIRWGGELRTVDGERIRFRSTECMAGYVASGRIAADKLSTALVVDFPDGWRLIDVQAATFLHSPNLASPDKLNLHAIRTDRMVRNLQDAYTGDLLTWDEVLTLVTREWGIGVAPSSGS